MSDWDTVTVLKKKPLKAAQMKTESAINQARKLIYCFSPAPSILANTILLFFTRFWQSGRQGLEVETHQKCK